MKLQEAIDILEAFCKIYEDTPKYHENLQKDYEATKTLIEYVKKHEKEKERLQ